MKRLVLLSIAIIGLLSHSTAQEKSEAKFGKVSPENFRTSVYNIDSSADAIVIADIGSTEIKGNAKGSFSLEYKTYRRAHIVNKNGYDIANVEIPIYTDGDAEEELLNLKAVTYNLEDGKVVETKLETKSAVFKDKINKNLVVKKFTFPNIKEGSIIEYQYTLNSDFIFHLQPWMFQGAYPRLWSEYNVSIPEFYYYVTLSQGYQPYFIKDQKNRRGHFTVLDMSGVGGTERTQFEAGVTDYRFVMKDVPGLKEESYTSTLDNHIAKIEFQLAELRYPFTPRNVMGTWTQASADLLKDEDFGSSLSKDNGWLNDVMPAAVGSATTKLAKAMNIYKYVRDNMTCTHYGMKYLTQSLKNMLKARNGNEAEINLLLVAMLRKANLDADPVMLSTRSHGYTYAMYPLLNKFNYVIAQVEIDGRTFHLDASRPGLGFGKLSYDCYNGHARVINTYATPLEFNPDSLLERKVTSVFVINNEKGNMSGSFNQVPGYYESFSLRGILKDKGKDYLFSQLKKDVGIDLELSNTSIDSLHILEEPVGVKYEFEMKGDKEDIIYLNPMFGVGYKENPFKSAERFYPVEMPYTRDETYLMQLEVPAGYVIDEMPKQTIVKLNEDNDGIFEYRLSHSNGVISMRTRLQIKRSYFEPQEYESLREFFNLVVKKHNEQIVFKKK